MEPKFEAEWNALQASCVAATVRDHALLRVSGADSTRWLNGMVTNSVNALQPGHGAYSFVLSAQGRLQGDCTIYRETPAEPASFLLSTTAAQVEVLQPWLDRYIIMDEVELSRTSLEDESLLLLGPGLEATLSTLGLPFPDPLRLVQTDTPEGPVLLLTPVSGQAPKVELRGAPGVIAALRPKLTAAGIGELSPQTLEAWRVFEGTPRFGTDLRDRDLPQETGQEHALHFAKGCYLGQEIVERIRSRGQVHRLFARFELTGELPSTLPATLEANGKAVGEITSVAEIPAEGGLVKLALGYARRELLATAAVLGYAGGTALPSPQTH